jgi:hypothetical protein
VNIKNDLRKKFYEQLIPKVSEAPGLLNRPETRLDFFAKGSTPLKSVVFRLRQPLYNRG